MGLCAFAYLFLFPWFPTLNNPNENVRLYMTAAIAESGTYEITALKTRWGWVNDGAIRGDKYFSAKAPGTSLLAVPFYAAYFHGARMFGVTVDKTAALWVCRVGATVLPWLLFLYFFHRWLSARGPQPLVDGVFYSVAFGSLLFAYGLLFVSHTTSAAAAFGAFMLIHDGRRRPGGLTGWRAVAAGFLAASVTALEYPGFVVSVVLAVYALTAVRGWRGLVGFAVGGLLPTLTVLHFHWVAFGHPLQAGHVFSQTPAFRAQHQQGFYGATGIHWNAARRLLFDPGMGLVPLTPVFAMAAVGLPVLIQRRDTRVDGIAAFAVILVTWVLISSMVNWRGGWTVGPRYLAVMVPFVAWAALEGLTFLWERLPRWREGLVVALLAAMLVGFAASGLPSAYYPHVPPEIKRPLQLIASLLVNGHGPRTLVGLLGVNGIVTLLPLLVVLGVSWIGVLREGTPRGLRRWACAAMAVAVASGGIFLLAGWRTTPKAAARIVKIESQWPGSP